MVEAQHTASTMKIVDSRDEQDVLEESKPARPAAAEALDFLLATPFRYDPRRGGSRFRAATDPGVFYGAESVRTAGAKLGYWRWRFLIDARPGTVLVHGPADTAGVCPNAASLSRTRRMLSAVSSKYRPVVSSICRLVRCRDPLRAAGPFGNM